MQGQQQRPSSPPPHPNYGESRGSRRQARAAASAERRTRAAALAATLSTPPSSATDAAHRWDIFYQTKPALFRDRHLLRTFCADLVSSTVAADPTRHLPPLRCACTPAEHGRLQHVDLHDVLSQARGGGCSRVLLEVGCGTGNAVYPLLRANDALYAICVDFSAKAVSHLRASSEYCPLRLHAFRADVTDAASYAPLLRRVVPTGVHYITAFWALSALHPSQFAPVARTLAGLLRTGGLLFVRDFAVEDMRQQAFERAGRCVRTETSGRLFLRGDGTYAYFFERQQLMQFFVEAGLVCCECEYEQRVVRNRKLRSTMHRRWLHAKFSKPPPPT